MTASFVLLVLLALIMFGAFPVWPHSRDWGSYPSGGAGVLIVVIGILIAAGRI